MDAIFIIKGGSNITIKKNEWDYYFRMFDATLAAKDIKLLRYSWQVVKKLEESEVSKEDCLLIKEYIGIYKAIYQSTMEDEMGKGLQIKGQNEIIGRIGNLLDCGIET
ncbi:hypothetical protein RhiirA5_422543 [Rhizophagus irregularis]|uniref:Uncharacterized protein n=1 Tax=Rhizophagus irregularis TaxID=588596 RepID=A0A2N0PBN4_9GLOM|nr:hypothetical protein RhiirA5_422543 [Rhizophagus irregularis]